jgi:hypothetical protein
MVGEKFGRKLVKPRRSRGYRGMNWFKGQRMDFPCAYKGLVTKRMAIDESRKINERLKPFAGKAFRRMARNFLT